MCKRWRVAAVLLTVLALVAGCSREADGDPQRPAAPAAGVPTVVVLDASDSMNTADAPGSRWEAAKAATRALVGSLPPGTEFGLVVFGAQQAVKDTAPEAGCDDVQVVLPLGAADADQVAKALDAVSARGYTPMGKALQDGAGLLPDTEASLVVVSDGESNCAPDPCETATSIRAAKPKTTISAVGFRTDAQSLQCVAREGGGVFLTAENAEQLTARLAAAQNVEAANQKLAPTGLGKARIGDSLEAVSTANPGFPTAGRTDGDRLIIVWKDCTYTFDADRKLVEIAPGDPAGATGVTIDGVKAGTAGSRVTELYGEPVSDRDGTATYVADRAAGTGYRIGYEGGARISEGTVTTVVLCRCAGAESEPKPEPVLGRDKFDRYAVGFGTVRPEMISMASLAANTVSDIAWKSWGGAEADGVGKSQQNGAANPMSTTYVRASDLGWCDGVWAYRGVRRANSVADFAVRPLEDVCKGDRSAPENSGAAPSSVVPSNGQRVCVFNAGTVPGLSSSTADRLKAAGYTVTESANLATSSIVENTVFYASGQEAAARELVRHIPNGAEAEQRPTAFQRCAGDLVVVLIK